MTATNCQLMPAPTLCSRLRLGYQTFFIVQTFRGLAYLFPSRISRARRDSSISPLLLGASYRLHGILLLSFTACIVTFGLRSSGKKTRWSTLAIFAIFNLTCAAALLQSLESKGSTGIWTDLTNTETFLHLIWFGMASDRKSTRLNSSH